MSSSATDLYSSVSRAAERFAAQVAGKRVLLGYSGGVDSHVLLYELTRVAPLHRITIVALHGNHQILPKSNQWEQHCRQICRKFGVQFRSHRLPVDFSREGGRENVLREARYAWFKSVMSKGDVLATAHHLDDQVETVLFRLFRGSGVRGLAGISPVRKWGQGELYRPFRDLWRSDIIEFAERHHLEWVEDGSNRDESLDRNFIRGQLMPILRSRWPGSPATIARASRHLAATEVLLEQIGSEDLGRWHLSADECQFTNFGKIRVSRLMGLSPERAANLLRCWGRRAAHESPGSGQLFELLRQLERSNGAMKARLVWKSAEFRRYRNCLYLLPAQADPMPYVARFQMAEPLLDLPVVGARLRLRRGIGQGIRASGTNIRGIEVRWYTQKIGLRLSREGRTRTLRNLFQELGVPPWERWRLPVLCIDDSVVYVPGIGVAANFAALADEPGIEFLLEER
jgi:tRNA(Ile)-lysidine synthase